MIVKRYPFYVGITTLVVTTVILLTGIFLWISHRESRTTAIQMADQLFSEINEKTLERYEHALASVAVLAGSAVRMPGMATEPVGGGLSHPGLALMFEALTFYEYLFSLYCGYDSGAFIQVVAVRNEPKLLHRFSAPKGTQFVLRTISIDAEGNLKQRWFFLNAQQNIIGERTALDPDYDPRVRLWYIRAQKEKTAFYTDPYIFSATKIPGVTCAERLVHGGGVFGADITLDRFSQSLERQKISQNGLLFLFDQEGRLIAHPNLRLVRLKADNSLELVNGKESPDPRIKTIVSRFQTDPVSMLNQTLEIKIDGKACLVRSTKLEAASQIDQILASVAPVSDFTGHIRRMWKRIFLFSGALLLIILPVVMFVSRKIAGSLTLLEKESRKIRNRDFSESDLFDSSIKEIHSLIQAFVLMKRTIRDYTARLIQAKQEIEALFTAITELLAGAIDAKSPYTGGHCKRVPVLAKLLADAAHDSDKSPFAGFRMDSEEKWREFNVAAWLHDCGKVTTPEYVVDKATKLETIYNRIHEIRMRFEVLLRDARIEAFRKHLPADVDEKDLLSDLEKTEKAIADDFAFVANCNIGGEFMADEKIERLERIASRTWVRHLDDRIGISQEEAVLKNTTPPKRLPAIEQVLADKPEHIIPRPHPDPFDGNPHGFKMEVPKNQYNQGELYNLGIRKGTLTAEDRFKINEHIIQTILMLKKLPFPNKMKDVAEIAGAHHETMIGTGYPRRLKKADMSIPARIMAIADIFEALTAADRPYKKAKNLSDALKIMSFMRNDQHIDADLFDLFLEKRIFQSYAEQYMNQQQIDKVNVDLYHSKRNNRQV
jgi:HD-GYP domain-containing protein (c-di-GMP phosphodiesterase class II)